MEWHLATPPRPKLCTFDAMIRFPHHFGLLSMGRTLCQAAIAALLLAFGSAAAAAVPLQCGEDSLEDNDTCGTALPISTPFSAAGLAVYKTDSDYYSLTVAPGQELQIDLFFLHLTADVDLFLYDLAGPCGGLTALSRSDSSSNDESLRWVNTGNSPVDVAIKVLVFPGSLAQCNNYEILVTLGLPVDLCDASVSDDPFEDNDICMAAFPIQFGLIQDLWVSRDDSDFWSFTVQPGDAVDAQIFFSDAVSDLDIFLYDAAGPCGGGFATGELATGFTQTDNERIIWTNTGSTARNVILQVIVFFSGSCNNYDMEIDVAGGGLGTNYCLAEPNSTGVIGLISAAGTTSVAMNDLRLSAKQLPTNAFGFFLNSLTQGFVAGPGNSDGNLCLGGSVGRHSQMIQNSGGGGSISITLDLTALPQPMGFVSASAGETWHFQAWHRDTASGGGVTSNFTNGITLMLTN